MLFGHPFDKLFVPDSFYGMVSLDSSSFSLTRLVFISMAFFVLISVFVPWVRTKDWVRQADGQTDRQ